MTRLKDGERFFLLGISIDEKIATAMGKWKRNWMICVLKYIYTYSKRMLGRRCCFFLLCFFFYLLCSRWCAIYVQNVRELLQWYCHVKRWDETKGEQEKESERAEWDREPLPRFLFLLLFFQEKKRSFAEYLKYICGKHSEK